jgi:hypothetical protein
VSPLCSLSLSPYRIISMAGFQIFPPEKI